MVINHTLKGELTSSLEVSRLTSRFTEGKDWKLHSYCRNVRKRQKKKKTVRATETEIANNLYMNWQEKNRISDEISELWIWVCCNIFKFYKSLNRSGYKGCFIFLRQNVLTFPQQTSACLLVMVVATQGFLPQDLHWLGCTQWGLATKVWERSIIGNHSRNSTKVIQPRWQSAQFIAALLLYNPHSLLSHL